MCSTVWPRNTKLALAVVVAAVAAATAANGVRASERIIKKGNRCSEASSSGAIWHSIIDHKFVTVKTLLHYS